MNSLVSPESQVGRKGEHRMSKVGNKNKRYAKCHGCTCKGAPTTGGGGRKASFDNNRTPQTSGYRLHGEA